MKTEISTTSATPPVSTAIREPGVFANSYAVVEPSSAYHMHRSTIQSCSLLKHALVSPAHYIQAANSHFKPSDEMEYGTLMHALILEPDTVPGLIAVYPGALGSDSDSIRFRASAKRGGRIAITLAKYIRAQIAAETFLAANYRGRSMRTWISEAKVERSIYFTEPVTGLLCRTRQDIYHPDVTFDLKTTSAQTAWKFMRDGVKYHYDLQSYMYSAARVVFSGESTRKPFVFAALCSDAPHSVFMLPADMSVLENGKKKFEHAMATVKACMSTDHWPGSVVEEPFIIHPWESWRPVSGDQHFSS